MGRAAVRLAVAAYFAPPNTANVATLYRSRPKVVPGQAYNLAAMGGSGAVVIVHLTRDPEVREAMGGLTSGERYNRHQVALEIRLQSVKPEAMDAQDDYDAVVDSIFAMIHADRTLGTGGGATGAVWQAGEGPAGIVHQPAEPVLTKQSVRLDGVVRFEAWEWVQA